MGPETEHADCTAAPPPSSVAEPAAPPSVVHWITLHCSHDSRSLCIGGSAATCVFISQRLLDAGVERTGGPPTGSLRRRISELEEDVARLTARVADAEAAASREAERASAVEATVADDRARAAAAAESVIGSAALARESEASSMKALAAAEALLTASEQARCAAVADAGALRNQLIACESRAAAAEASATALRDQLIACESRAAAAEASATALRDQLIACESRAAAAEAGATTLRDQLIACESRAAAAEARAAPPESRATTAEESAKVVASSVSPSAASTEVDALREELTQSMIRAAAAEAALAEQSSRAVLLMAELDSHRVAAVLHADTLADLPMDRCAIGGASPVVHAACVLSTDRGEASPRIALDFSEPRAVAHTPLAEMFTTIGAADVRDFSVEGLPGSIDVYGKAISATLEASYRRVATAAVELKEAHAVSIAAAAEARACEFAARAQASDALSRLARCEAELAAARAGLRGAREPRLGSAPHEFEPVAAVIAARLEDAAVRLRLSHHRISTEHEAALKAAQADASAARAQLAALAALLPVDGPGVSTFKGQD